jgi:hypothetical protein
MRSKKFKVGDAAKLPKEFSFTNTAGGTGTANSSWSSFSENFTGDATVKVTKTWGDYEIGRRYIGEAVSADLVKFLEEFASATDKRVFFSEFDLEA